MSVNTGNRLKPQPQARVGGGVCQHRKQAQTTATGTGGRRCLSTQETGSNQSHRHGWEAVSVNTGNRLKPRTLARVGGGVRQHREQAQTTPTGTGGRRCLSTQGTDSNHAHRHGWEAVYVNTGNRLKPQPRARVGGGVCQHREQAQTTPTGTGGRRCLSTQGTGSNHAHRHGWEAVSVNTGNRLKPQPQAPGGRRCLSTKRTGSNHTHMHGWEVVSVNTENRLKPQPQAWVGGGVCQHREQAQTTATGSVYQHSLDSRILIRNDLRISAIPTLRSSSVVARPSPRSTEFSVYERRKKSDTDRIFWNTHRQRRDTGRPPC